MADVVDEVIMDSADENDDIITRSPEELAELKKENGNQLYKIKQYRSALPLYSEAIKLCPNTAAYYGNRAACYMMLNRFIEALEDVRRCVQLDPKFVKGYVRMAKCSLAMGDLKTAEFAIKKVQDMQVDGQTIANELKSYEKLKQYESESNKAYEKQDYRKVVFCMDRCMDEAPTCNRYKLIKAECLTFLGRFQEAQDIANSILHIDKGNADAIYVRGMCLFYEDNLDSAFQHFQQVLRLAPDHKKAMNIYKKAKLLKKMKEDGNEAYKACKFQDAYNLYTEALKIDPLNKKTNAKLYFNRATVLSRLAKTREAIDDCTAALNLDESYIKALLRRAKCYADIGEHEDAVRDYEKVFKMDKSRENKKLLQDAKLALKLSKRKDYYSILGVERNAGEDEIKKAYKKRALIHHPDRHANASESEKKEQEKKFKDVGEAYGVLSDPKKKMRYDNGQDLDEFDGGMPDVDPTQVFQRFFGGSSHGGQEFSFGGGFPGSFTFQFR
ncbi:dnaJ homolog subfamily C member 7 [Diorhabda sublineata]|uniref:dnaJ homolog subfamily C member 7 n=1 Tax=Diorhabda sublineata TaxID=1163346 RepID=UPI0024E1079B|nr:dnaJ homolog subfamily C member 7 [Diorhabda sublineata]